MITAAMATPTQRNPFTPRLGAEPPVLVGRDDAMRDFGRLLNGTGKPLLIHGLRGYGKTVLLNHMRDVARAYRDERAPKRWVVSSRADQTITPNLNFERTAEVIATDLLEKINPGSKALKGLMKFAGSIEEVGAGGVSIKRRLADPTVAAGVHQHIIDLFLRVVEEATSCGAGVLLVFDELQALDPVNLSALLTALSVATGKDEYFSMVAAGLPSLRGKCSRALESMDKLFELEELEALGRKDAERALHEPAKESGKPFTAEALAKTLAMMRGYPYFVQFYGFWLWEDALGNEITVADIDRLKPAIGRRLISTFYDPKWIACSKPARQYLAAMAALRRVTVANAAVAARLGVQPRHLLRPRSELLEAGLIYEGDDDDLASDEIAVAFAYPFLGEDLRKDHGLAEDT